MAAGDRLHFIGTATTVVTLGSFTILTDPNFLHRGQRAYLGWGLSSRRLSDPAVRPEDLPPLDVVLLSHLHGDHFDRVSRERLDRTPPVLSTRHATRRLDRWGFDTAALEPWDQHHLAKGSGGREEHLRVTAVPAVHARGLLGRMLPPVMGSVVEHVVDGAVRRSVYFSGDTLTGDHVDEVRRRFPDIDAAVVHLGGTRVLMRTVTMDAAMGVDFVERCRPSVVVPVHHDDYTVFRSPLSDFVDRATARGLGTRLRCPARGEVVSLDPDVPA
ncbi:L-ascorbate metabolism protein UlaG (beta-lactamase superfamily) [Nocardioides cavernae]|uniref:L-ascorbate metabolism protein UlaG (Beta-lactamase superfamily) n=1 Tax=Nocardioides cavernae TaxID=1921566 RepID=A0A7Y9H4L2_9ACTN|nr:MBL fold metallo-hydrolase [Nocardioides cavernae]NYE37608.1 L-ascorbate metabolism protein UlaG (beta-lactamase superfamily) [Nocardioides cavernae]